MARPWFFWICRTRFPNRHESLAWQPGHTLRLAGERERSTGVLPLSALHDHYVYYRIAPDAKAEFIPVAVAMQSDIYRLCGVRGRLKKKSFDAATWMEIYEGVHQRLLFEASLADCVARFGICAFLAAGSTRHDEIFHDPLA